MSQWRYGFGSTFTHSRHSRYSRFSFDLAHRRRIESGIDVGDFSGNATGEVAAEEGRRIADFVNAYVAAQRRLLFGYRQQFPEISYARRRKGLDRAGRNGVYAYAFWTQALRHIAHVRFQAGLGKSHHVVAGKRPFR